MGKRGFYLAIALVLCVLPCTTSFARDRGVNETLTIEQALALSVKSHPRVLAKQQEYEAAVGDFKAARWAAFPDAGYSFRGFQENGDQETLDQEVLTVTQPVWTGGRLSGNVSIAKSKRDAAQFAIIETEQKLLTDTVRSFIEFYRAKSKVDISRNNVKEHKRLSKIIERRVNAATSPEVDLRLANARLAFSESQLMQNMNALENSKADLEQLVGQQVFEITAPQNADIGQFSFIEVENAAVKFSPTIKRLKAEIAGLKAAEKVSKSALYPQLTLGYEKSYGDLRPNQDDEQVFLGLDFQPGAGLSSQASINVSQAKKNALQNTLIASQRDVVREVKITWQEYSAAKLQLSPTRQLVDTTSDVVESYLRQYTVGRKSWLDVLNAQREMVQAKFHWPITALYFSSFKVKILTGDLNKNTAVAAND